MIIDKFHSYSKIITPYSIPARWMNCILYYNSTTASLHIAQYSPIGSSQFHFISFFFSFAGISFLSEVSEISYIKFLFKEDEGVKLM